MPKSDTPPGDRIAKVLARAGVASRRDAEGIIAAGRVAVNGRVIDSPALNVSPGDRITLDGEPLADAEPPRLWLFHKPAGIVTTARDEKGRQTVFDILPDGMPRVMTVGRLDLTSEGLLLLTNDGDIKRKLELPETGWTRKYRVRVNGRPTDDQLQPLRDGITLDGERFQPMTVAIDRQQGANAWLTVAIREGKNREIRRAMEAVGLVVNRLIRTGYGPFRLADLAPGAVEEVRPRVLKDQLGLAETPGRGAAAEARQRAGDAAPKVRTVVRRAAGPDAAKPRVRRMPERDDSPADRPVRRVRSAAATEPAAPHRQVRVADDARPPRQAAGTAAAPTARKPAAPRRVRDGDGEAPAARAPRKPVGAAPAATRAPRAPQAEAPAARATRKPAGPAAATKARKPAAPHGRAATDAPAAPRPKRPGDPAKPRGGPPRRG